MISSDHEEVQLPLQQYLHLAHGIFVGATSEKLSTLNSEVRLDQDVSEISLSPNAI
jgi:hypothetical protein